MESCEHFPEEWPDAETRLDDLLYDGLTQAERDRLLELLCSGQEF